MSPGGATPRLCGAADGLSAGSIPSQPAGRPRRLASAAISGARRHVLSMPVPSIHHLASAWALLARYQAMVLARPALQARSAAPSRRAPASSGSTSSTFIMAPSGLSAFQAILPSIAGDRVDRLDQLADRRADAGADVQAAGVTSLYFSAASTIASAQSST